MPANNPNNVNAQTVQGPDPTGNQGYPLAVVPAIGADPFPVSGTVTANVPEPLEVEGDTAEGAAATENPVLIGMKDTAGNKRALLSRTDNIPLLVHSTVTVDAIADGGFVDEGGNVRAIYVANTVADNVSGGVFDGQRGVVNLTLLTLAARTVTTASSAQVNRSNAGIWLHLRVTVAPGAQTLTLSIQLQSGSGGLINVHTFAPVGGTGNFYYFLHPGAVNTLALANVFCQSLYLGRDWAAEVAHSGAGSWTYALGGGYIYGS